MTIRMTNAEFINKANLVHNNKYSYENVDYVNNHTKVFITCLSHGDFLQSPNSHLSKHGCPECKKEHLSQLKIKDSNEFIQECLKIHDGKYSYEKAVYAGAFKKIEIICPLHGSFKQTPDSHKNQKAGCPQCSTGGFGFGHDGSFYIQELLENDICIAYKFGIAKNIKTRMKNQKSKSKLEHKLIFSFESTGMEVYRLEQIIKTTLSCNYLDKSVLPDGYTETLSPEDILTLENIIMNFLLGDKHE